MNKYLFIIVFHIILTCCSRASDSKSITNTYYDLKDFLKKEAKRLAVKNKPVQKTVSKNNENETRKQLIKSWPSELNLFIQSDINKPAWKRSYKISEYSDRITYSATDSTLRTQQIQIYKDPAGSIKQILIINSSRNMLYKSYEKLNYFTDSIYRIEKVQRITLLGSNTYKVTGVFIKEK